MTANLPPLPVEPAEATCRFGWTEYDGARYCHEHRDFLEPGVPSRLCTTARAALTPEVER